MTYRAGAASKISHGIFVLCAEPGSRFGVQYSEIVLACGCFSMLPCVLLRSPPQAGEAEERERIDGNGDEARVLAELVEAMTREQG